MSPTGDPPPAGGGAAAGLRLRRRHRLGEHVVEVAFTEVDLDLSEREGSNPATLAAALRAVEQATGRPVVRMHQVHGGDVAEVDDPPASPPRVDALVTTRPDLTLMTRAADCVPVLLAGRRPGPGGVVLGAAHAGRGGVLAGVATRAAERMRELGATEVNAWVGPRVCGACYEVPGAMRAEVAGAVPESWSETRWGTPALDLGAGVAAQLLRSGCAVRDVGGCTMEDPALPSHRRDGAGATRFAGLAWVREARPDEMHETDEEV